MFRYIDQQLTIAKDGRVEMGGLKSTVTVVEECDPRSSMITARIARGRPVDLVSGDGPCVTCHGVPPGDNAL